MRYELLSRGQNTGRARVWMSTFVGAVSPLDENLGSAYVISYRVAGCVVLTPAHAQLDPVVRQLGRIMLPLPFHNIRIPF